MMIVDCQTCPVRDVHCADCVVTAFAALPHHAADRAPVAVPVPRVRRPLTAAGPAETLSAAPVGEVPERSAVPDEADTVPLDRAERRALAVLIGAGLVDHETANHARAELTPRTGHPRHTGHGAPSGHGVRRAM